MKNLKIYFDRVIMKTVRLKISVRRNHHPLFKSETPHQTQLVDEKIVI